MSHEKVKFDSHYVSWYCPSCRFDGWNVEVPDCISGGRYCAPDPDDDLGPLTGKDVVMEDLR